MILDRFRLDGQVAVVTGGNRGLGLSIAAALSEAGADIVSVHRTSETTELAERVEYAQRRLLSLSLDLTADHVAETVLEKTLANFGRVDILVNNAGVQRRAPATSFTLSDWDEVMHVNLNAVFTFCQVFGREMIRQRHGKIINIGSLLSFQGGYTVPAYVVSKHGISGLTKALCNEWANLGVNVNAIAPGYMDTEMNSALRADVRRDQEISTRIPAGRWGMPEDMGGAAVFLASEASNYVHGQVLVVDGGWMAR